MYIMENGLRSLKYKRGFKIKGKQKDQQLYKNW